MDFGPVALWQSMGTIAKAVTLLLLVMSVYSLTVAFERALTYRKAKKESPRVRPSGDAVPQAEPTPGRDRGCAQVQALAPREGGRGWSARVPEREPALARSTGEDVIEAAASRHRAHLADHHRRLQARHGRPRHDRRHRAVRRPVRHRDRHHQRVQGHGAHRLGRHRRGLGGYRRGARHDGVRSVRRHPGRVALQLPVSRRSSASRSR